MITDPSTVHNTQDVNCLLSNALLQSSLYSFVSLYEKWRLVSAILIFADMTLSN